MRRELHSRRLMTCGRLVGVLALVASSAGGAIADGTLETVSPGDLESGSLEGRCPTFSWTAVNGAVGYEIVVYEFSEANLRVSEEPVLAHVVPGGAVSWSPPRTSCLAAGRHYAWTVRAVGRAVGSDDADRWSAVRLFRTESGLEDDQVAEALAIVQRYLEEGGDLGASGGGRASASVSKAGLRTLPAQRSVSFAGDGSVSEPLWASNLEPLQGSTPETVPRPIDDLGISSFVDGEDDVAVRGEVDNGLERAIGYLGVSLEAADGNFDGLAALGLWAEGLDAGVLGVAATDDLNGVGVVGAAVGEGTGGVFWNRDPAAFLRNEVRLATETHALSVSGTTRLSGDVTVSSVFGLRVGGWEQVVGEGNGAATATCPQGKTIVFGLGWHMTDLGRAQPGPNAFKACTPGLTACSVTQGNTGGDDEMRVWAVCSP